MNFLEKRILKDGQIRPGQILKVDEFLNHQLDVSLLDEIGKALYEKYKDKKITRILTIEASGIAIACMAGQYFNVPVVFAKKSKSKNIDGDVYTSKVFSYTYGKEYTITLAKKFLTEDDNILLIDDFLANGKAMKGLLDICKQSGSSVAGIGIAIEKGFQVGGKELRDAGYDLTSIAIVDEMNDDGTLKFRENDI